VRKQLKLNKRQPMTLTPEQYAYYYASPPATLKQYPWRWIYDHSGVYTPYTSPGTMNGMSAQAAGDDAVQALNYGKSSHVMEGSMVQGSLAPSCVHA
jgi:hypothetical protein